MNVLRSLQVGNIKAHGITAESAASVDVFLKAADTPKLR
jgi:hypothetical protein